MVEYSDKAMGSLAAVSVSDEKKKSWKTYKRTDVPGSVTNINPITQCLIGDYQIQTKQEYGR